MLLPSRPCLNCIHKRAGMLVRNPASMHQLIRRSSTKGLDPTTQGGYLHAPGL